MANSMRVLAEANCYRHGHRWKTPNGAFTGFFFTAAPLRRGVGYAPTQNAPAESIRGALLLLTEVGAARAYS
ncbi:hypothetical protein LJR220_006182 [Bradyrhizobium sp. LjRoot220]|uniref:hypothetical protein n=1 Tax=Bradyrhizobium sp. LjRoot220 TaxID=3342284 RepID=UPI003ECDD39C